MCVSYTLHVFLSRVPCGAPPAFLFLDDVGGNRLSEKPPKGRGALLSALSRARSGLGIKGFFGYFHETIHGRKFTRYDMLCLIGAIYTSSRDFRTETLLSGGVHFKGRGAHFQGLQ